MIICNQEIAVHLRLIRNLAVYTSGRFALRISLTHGPALHATPLNIIEKELSKTENRSEFDEQHYVSRTISLKSGAHVELNEIVIFKLDVPAVGPKDDEGLSLTCQLIQVDQTRHKVVGVFKGSLIGTSLQEYLEMDFYDSAPCQVIGSVHRCTYKFQFSGDQGGVDLRSFCQKFCSTTVDQMLDYLRREGQNSYRGIAEIFSLMTARQVEISCPQPEEEPIFKPAVFKPTFKMVMKDVAQRETQFTEGDEEPGIEIKLEKKKRRRIFSTSKEHRLQKYQSVEKVLHENAQKVYALWRELVGELFGVAAGQFMAERGRAYRLSLKQKMGQSIARFKGSWDVDTYGDEELLRNKLAHQLRSQDREFFRQLRGPDSLSFPVLNDTFFSNQRPIFFEERASNGQIEIETPTQIFVALVHGLGACRLDMQKIRVQLKRYYEGKIKIFVSSSNQGRTQGDIDSMGMRLAAQLDLELSKLTITPKICILGHSMGGLIIRSALPRLEKYKRYFHSLITLSSPHLGYAYSTSKLVDAGLWMINQMKKCTSILQMTMNDNQKIQETFVYKLSQKPGIEWFKKVILLASHQDLYVPYYSARIQKHQESSLDCRKQVRKGVVYCDMIDGLLSRFKGEIIRLNVNFSIPQQNFDNLIGRAAHISFINNVEMVRTFVFAGTHYFF